jgi:hypothetical protein
MILTRQSSPPSELEIVTEIATEVITEGLQTSNNFAAGRPSREKRVPGAGLWRTTADPVKPSKRTRLTMDLLPQTLPAPPPSMQDAPTDPDLLHTSSSSSAALSPSTHPRVAHFRHINTPHNVFGLWRRFFAKTVPSHDPEELVTLEGLSDIEEPILACAQEVPYSPYPNKSSFLLGEWYWDDRTQKSHKCFDRLLKIIGDPNFKPEDVRHTKWKSIDARLAGMTHHEVDGDEEWLDAGWETKEIRVSVPFPRHAAHPGPHEYSVGTLYYRSIVDVIREKFSNLRDFQHYRIEPFELFWSSQEGLPSTRVHGELYTSPAFLEEHHKIQELAVKDGWGEYPRHVVALMFASDVTHLTSFGTAYLWPCYMYFGNESKYRRGQPSCRSCNHIAYFQKVLFSSSSSSHWSSQSCRPSFQMPVRTF